MTMLPEWQKRLAALKEDLNLTDDAIGLLAIQLKFRLDDAKSIAVEAITGGGDDKKCDLIYVDKELQVAVIAQCYVSKKIKASAPANKASDLNTAIGWILTRNIEDLPDGLKGRADELRNAIANGDIKQIYVWYVHNLPSSRNVANELRTVEQTCRTALREIDEGSGINIFAEEIGHEAMARLYEKAERTIIVTERFNIRPLDAIEVKSQDWSAVVTTVSAQWLAELFKKFGTDLFSANLRGYLGSRSSDSNINNGIKTSASEEPDNFWVYNNGVTALVLDYSLGPRLKSGRKLTIDGISVVNGAQTTGSLGSIVDALSNDILVPIRFVKSDKDSIVNKVVRFNNLQNKLQAADFRSTDQIQDRLRSEFEKIPSAEYEGGRRGGVSDTIKRSKFTLPSYAVGQSLTAFHGDPVTAYDKKSEIWTAEAFYRRVFTERTTARHIIFAYSLLDSINEERLSLNNKQRIDASALTQTEKNTIAFLNKKGSAFLLIYVASMCMEAIINQPVSNKFDIQFRRNIAPIDAAENWKPILSLFLSLSNQLDACFSRNRISNERVQRTVPNFVGLIASLKSIHEQTFASFAKNVHLRQAE